MSMKHKTREKEGEGDTIINCWTDENQQLKEFQRFIFLFMELLVCLPACLLLFDGHSQHDL